MNADELLASVKRATILPPGRLSDADVLALADEEIQTKLMPMLAELRNEYLVTSEPVSIVPGQLEYRIPYRAVGRTLRDVRRVANGTTESLPYVTPEAAHLQGAYGFSFRADKVILTPGMTGDLELFYELRPSRLVLTQDCARVASVTPVAVVVDAVPATIVNGAFVDLVQARSGHALHAKDVPVTDVSGTTLTLAVPTDLVVGDFISPAETSNQIMMPDEMHQVLAQAVGVRVLEAIGDFEALASHQARLNEKMSAVRSLLSPRVRGEPQIIMSQNGVLTRRFRG